jgi:hypothetical protein
LGIDLFTEDWRDVWGSDTPTDDLGVVYTQEGIVRLMLDVCGYVPSADILTMRVLEPSCGDGAFVGEIVHRLAAARKRTSSDFSWSQPEAVSLIKAYDISEESVRRTRERVKTVLLADGATNKRAAFLAAAWVEHADFLLAPARNRFDLVVGNPPYVRLEEIPKAVLQAYRSSFETFGERSDLYVPFFEKSLDLLAPTGSLAFICSNRWAKNRYGMALRRRIAARHGVRLYLNMEHTQPFDREVSAYPAIFVLSAGPAVSTAAATIAEVSTDTLNTITKEFNGKRGKGRVLSHFSRWYPDGEPWTATSTKEQRALKVVSKLSPIEESAIGTRIGIGVATGADRVFILRADDPQANAAALEGSRILKLGMSAGAQGFAAEWQGHYLLNPFEDEDRPDLIDLRKYPRLADYLRGHETLLKKRHVAKSRPHAWYRTIDRIWPSLASRPKLLIPDIQPGNLVSLDEGGLYPHHNLYWITSDEWPLPALQALLRGKEVRSQVAAFSVQMRGGSLRYQAQTLRRVRIPSFQSLKPRLLDGLVSAAHSHEQAAIEEIVTEAFST